MKTSVCLALITLCAVPLPAGDSVSLIASRTSGAASSVITLAEGDLAELTYAYLPQGNEPTPQHYTIEFERDGQRFTYRPLISPASGSTHPTILNPLKIAGPGTVKLLTAVQLTSLSAADLATFKITRAGGDPAVTPTNSVVIPNDSTGSYQVILESSTDLITWTTANPGTYSGGTQKRFFRTRVTRLP